ncbi:hypothetical protein HNY73_021974 [Argiope bruennichi]|uniref:Uncharacterized protein n=1 Tax=Argiope bruennichi TaxID=94029 RepID=A0A8T0E0S9_ARGBR|nr:hypothetical protein HNY73_021974 [Argiope bruennichi]
MCKRVRHTAWGHDSPPKRATDKRPPGDDSTDTGLLGKMEGIKQLGESHRQHNPSYVRKLFYGSQKLYMKEMP